MRGPAVVAVTVLHNTLGPDSYNYRPTASIWMRQVFSFHPNAAVMAHVPLIFQIHFTAAWCRRSRRAYESMAPAGQSAQHRVAVRLNSLKSSPSRDARGRDMPSRVNE